MVLLYAAAVMLGLGLAFTIMLAIAHVKLAVDEDPRVQQAVDALPAANCGGCGYAGCQAYAEAVVRGDAAPNLCSPGGPSVAQAVAQIMGLEVGEAVPMRAVIRCSATIDQRLQRAVYTGLPTCAAADLISGIQGCVYGCLGLGDCADACPFDSIRMVDGLAVVDCARCVGCGACVKACPRGIIDLVPMIEDPMLVVACSSKDKGPVVRKVCRDVGCIGCGLCAKASDVFSVTDFLAHIDYDKYTTAADLAPAVEKCPRQLFRYIGTQPAPQPAPAQADA